MTTRYEGGIRGSLKQTRQTGIGQSICIHDISDLISRVFSAFLKRTTRSCVEFSPSFLLFFPFSLSYCTLSHQHLCFPLYHFVTSLSLSLSTLLSSRFLSRSLLFRHPSTLLLPVASMERVYTGEKEGRKTSTGWKVLPLIHG